MFEKEKKQYEEDCKTHERPWELWQYTSRDQSSSDWHSLETHPKWSGHCIYHRKQTTFMPEYYSGLNWRDAEHLIGKTVECTNNPDAGWSRGILMLFDTVSDTYYKFAVKKQACLLNRIYIRTCEETFNHPTINIGGVDLPKPETVAPACNEFVWGGYNYNIENLQAGIVHFTKYNAKAWADWWKTNVIDKMK